MNQNVDKVKEIDQYNFWKSYLSLMMVVQDTLSNGEKDVMACLLEYDYRTPAFPRGRASEIAKKLNVKQPYISLIKDSLVEKKWLEYEDGSLYIAKSVRAFQKFVQDSLEKGGLELNFTFPYKIIKDD